LESFIDTHGEEAQKLIGSTLDDLKKAAAKGDNSGEAVLKVISEAGTKVQKLVGESSAKAWSALGEKYPELKSQLGESGEELSKVVEKQCVALSS
jgi:phage-related protein